MNDDTDADILKYIEKLADIYKDEQLYVQKTTRPEINIGVSDGTHPTTAVDSGNWYGGYDPVTGGVATADVTSMAEETFGKLLIDSQNTTYPDEAKQLMQSIEEAVEMASELHYTITGLHVKKGTPLKEILQGCIEEVVNIL